MIDRRSSLNAEASELRDMIRDLPQRAVLEKRSLESRLKQVELEIVNLPLETICRRTSLTFRGAPVRGSKGITAAFGSRAARKFADAYSATVAGMKKNFRYMGPIPDRASSELLLVGTAIGSFGFEFELPSVEPDLLVEDQTFEEKAVERIRSLMEVSAKGSDEEIGEIVDDIHPRAVKRIAEFIKLMSQSDATCALEIGQREFRYQNSEEVNLSIERLADENIREFKDILYGAFVGVLPNRRNFEFQVADSDSEWVILGKLSPRIEDPDVINGLIGRLFNVEFDVLQVGQGRPRYTLNNLNFIK